MGARYDRQIPLIGAEGQERLRSARVGIAGCGGLGNMVVTDLAAAGVGFLKLVDGDKPDVSNLNRQFVFREKDKRGKAKILADWARRVNPDVDADGHNEWIMDNSVDRLFGDCDILVDCLDDMESRIVLDRYACDTGKTLVHAGVSGFEAQVTVVVPGKTQSLRSIYEKVRVDKEVVPSLGAMVTMVGSIEALQVIQVITGTGHPLVGRMMVIDMVTGSVDYVKLD